MRADTQCIEAADRIEALEAALREVDRLALVIESAVRHDAPSDHRIVLAAIQAVNRLLGEDPIKGGQAPTEAREAAAGMAATQICPACWKPFTDGQTCGMGGCPMGGDF